MNSHIILISFQHDSDMKSTSYRTNRVTRRYHILKPEETLNVVKIGPFQTTHQKNKNKKEQGPNGGKSSPSKTNP